MSAISYLNDTDWSVSHMNRVPRVTNRFRQLLPLGVGLSMASLGELWEGVHFSRDPDRSRSLLNEFLMAVTLVPIFQRICERFGYLRGLFRKTGASPGDMDLLIAATALEHNLTLLSNNRKHFCHVTGLRFESI